jgi:hypothetical protein
MPPSTDAVACASIQSPDISGRTPPTLVWCSKHDRLPKRVPWPRAFHLKNKKALQSRAFLSSGGAMWTEYPDLRKAY